MTVWRSSGQRKTAAGAIFTVRAHVARRDYEP
jgi:hypothetical protein